MHYLPLTENDLKLMLAASNKESIDDFFTQIPGASRIQDKINIPSSMGEAELVEYFKKLGGKNRLKYLNLVGGGAYNHFIPTVCDSLISRSEFYTAYTPYQPEISQGTLQAIFEFQSMISEIFNMDVSNGSMYDGAHATAEAALMATRITGKKEVVIDSSLAPNYQDVLKTYSTGGKVIPIFIDTYHDIDEENRVKLYNQHISENTAAILVQSPDFFGNIHDLSEARRLCDEYKILLIVIVTEPLAYGLFTPPGDYGADIVAGEAMSFGLSLNYGGPYLGFFAARREHVRNMPGRIVGMTEDACGKRGYVLTLSTREQHIRRERATSNICTNQALCATQAAIYLSLLGKTGFPLLAKQNYNGAHYFADELSKIDGIDIVSKNFFNEFTVRLDDRFDNLYGYLFGNKIIFGLKLEKFYEDLKNHFIISVTEMVKRFELDNVIQLIKAYDGTISKFNI